MASRRGSPRVFLGPIEIAGFFSGLERGFRAAGVGAEFMDISGDPLMYRRSTTSRHPRRLGLLPALAAASARARRGIARVVVFLAAVWRYDVFIIGGTGFWGGRELPILRALGKRTVWVFLGSDHRPPYLNGKTALRQSDFRALERETRRISRRVHRVERWANLVVAHEASAQFHRRPFVRLLELGLPIDLGRHETDPQSSRLPQARNPGQLRVLHCPTDPVAKGTERVRSIIDALRSEGITVRYTELVGRPHNEVLDAVESTDLIIDEVYGDSPMGVLATEAAWFGRAAVCGGYYAGAPCPPLADGQDFPVAYVEPDQLLDRVRTLLTSAAEREGLAGAARNFVRARWSPRSVADRFGLLLGGAPPQEWLVNPAEVRYIGGYGIARTELRRYVRTFVAAAGVSALCLEGRPDLVRGLLSGDLIAGAGP